MVGGGWGRRGVGRGGGGGEEGKRRGGGGGGGFFFKDAAATEIYTGSIVGSVRCV